MADKFPGRNGTKLHRWQRNSLELIGLVQTYYRGTELFDLRIWYKKEGAHYPSRSGISFREDEIEKLYRAVRKARSAIESRKRKSC